MKKQKGATGKKKRNTTKRGTFNYRTSGSDSEYLKEKNYWRNFKV